MLSVSAGRWPDAWRWVLQPKWDGFLIEARAGGEVRGWSRHGTDLTARLGSLLAPFTEVVPGTTFDGELVAVSERDGKPIQDFAAVTRAVFTGRPAATDRLRFVAFDVLAVAGEDVRPRPWEDRDARLHETLPVRERIRVAVSQAGDAGGARGDRRPRVRGHGPETRGIGVPPRTTPHLDQAQGAIHGPRRVVFRSPGSRRLLARPLRVRWSPCSRARRRPHRRADRTARGAGLLSRRRRWQPARGARRARRVTDSRHAHRHA